MCDCELSTRESRGLQALVRTGKLSQGKMGIHLWWMVRALVTLLGDPENVEAKAMIHEFGGADKLAGAMA